MRTSEFERIQGYAQAAPDRGSYTIVVLLECRGASCAHTIDLMIYRAQLRGADR